jgi:hypothetical protein
MIFFISLLFSQAKEYYQLPDQSVHLQWVLGIEFSIKGHLHLAFSSTQTLAPSLVPSRQNTSFSNPSLNLEPN